MIRTAWYDDRIDGVPRIPVGEWIDTGFEWFKDTFDNFFDAVSDGIEATVNGLADVLQWPPALVMALIFALIAWAARDWKLGVGTMLGMTLIISMAQWDYAMDTLALILVAAVIALVIGIPLGILAAQSEVVSRIVRPIMDLMQTMPAFVWLVPVVSLFSIGVSGALVATVIFALPPGVRFTELGIRQVEPEVVEAGHAFGATSGQILRRIQLPLATPTVMAGVNQVIMLALSMAVIAGLVGGGGLGSQVTTSISRLDIGLGFEAGLSVVILAIFLDRVTAAIGGREAGRGRFKGLFRPKPAQSEEEKAVEIEKLKIRPAAGAGVGGAS
ncbi:ABC transporter permease [Nocardioides insulae]|uniref:ABC transporter permease n=1 Tax=Nocardioides insulae TaxID=394734 RepID=UPI000424565C|nr:proline/glycine betaine ABC transporter permease [Nocardioides insulae]